MIGTADLHDVTHFNAAIYGAVYNDSKQRFPDGSPVALSTVENIETTDGVTYITTKNTCYRVVGKIANHEELSATSN